MLYKVKRYAKWVILSRRWAKTRFNVYINELVSRVSNLGKGIEIDDENLSILMYADDVVILSESKEDLQMILNIY